MLETAQTRNRKTAAVAVCAVLAGALVMEGCLFQKKKARVFVPPPVFASLPPEVKPITLPAPPEMTGEVGPGVELPLIADVSLPPPPPLPAAPKAPARPPAPPVVVDTTPAPAAPKAAPVISAEERRQLNQDLDERLERVRRVLARAEGRTLSPDLATLANNARALLVSAEQARSQDLVTAVNLAKRADLFAMDLAQRLP